MKIYGLIGKKLGHSFSRSYFTRKFEELAITDCEYRNFEIAPIDELPGLIRQEPCLRGLNITIPYKEEVLPFLHETDGVVQETGACNCLRIREGRLEGFNTDVTGFRRSLEPLLQPQHQRALVLGTGGAAKAVVYVLQKLGIAATLVSRKKEDALLTYGALEAGLMERYPLIINTTPLGMYPNVNELPPLPYDAIGPRHLLFDLIYNPAQTRFLEEGAKRGAVTANGHQMLVIQAEESWRIWNEGA